MMELKAQEALHRHYAIKPNSEIEPYKGGKENKNNKELITINFNLLKNPTKSELSSLFYPEETNAQRC